MEDEKDQQSPEPAAPAETQTKHPEWKVKFVEFINKTIQNPRECPVCQHEVTIGNHLVSPLILDDNAIHIGGAMYPQIMLICSHCGYTRYFNAVAIGAVERDK